MLLTSPPVLTIPDINKPFELICDASMIRLAAVLLQEGKVVAYESRKLKGGESNYHAPALEALAVVHAFNLWRCYLEGNHTVVYTDHNPLLHLMSQPTLNRMQARWVVALQSFSHEWKHKAGKLNPADGLTRIEGSTAGSNTVPQSAVQSHVLNGDVEPMTVGHSCESPAASAILTVNTHEQVNSFQHILLIALCRK